MTAILGRILIYTKKVEEMVDFYTGLFGFEAHCEEGDRLVELRHPDTEFALLLHPASKGQKEGQALIKLVFDVRDVAGFCREAEAKGIAFGPLHHADGYVFANAKDPSKNSVSVSSRAYRDDGGV
ncbi:VOC family protein [Celeribacter baekdonensis]|uniref:VOC family protein n=1 Tax=Celeribacter baekdonensis TaxID=875171 RepID=UPI003A942308